MTNNLVVRTTGRYLAVFIVSLLVCIGTAAAAESYTYVTMWGSQGSGDGEFQGPQAVAVDSAGNVYVLDTGNNRVEKFDAAGAFMLAWGGPGQNQSEFDSPQGIAVDTSDFVYVADTGNHRIQKFNSAGTFLTEWGSQGSGDGQFESPIGITTDSADAVYVADSGNCRVQKFDSVGVSFGAWTVDFNPFGIAVDGSNVYVSDNGGRILKFNSAGVSLLEWAAGSPSHLAVDGAHRIFSVSTDQHIVQKFDGDGALVAEWGSEGAGESQFEAPRGIAVTDDNHVFVADTGNNRVQAFALVEPPPPAITSITPNYGTQGETVNVRIDGTGFLAGAAVRLQMDGHTDITATDVTVVSGQRITCTVTLKDSQTLGAWAVRVTNTDGQYAILANGFEVVAPVTSPPPETYSFESMFGGQGSGDGEFNSPQGVTTDTAGNIYVVDRMNHRIQKFASDGTFLTKWGRNGGDGSAGAGDGEFNSPQGIAIDAAGNLYVTDTWNNRVQKFTSAGEFITRWGSYGSDDTQFNTPLGIAVDEEGMVYVVDSQNSRVAKYSSDGNFITKWGIGDIGNPTQIAISHSNVYVKSTDIGGNRLISRYNNVGSMISVWTVESDGFPSSGLASDASGNLYTVRRNSNDGTPFRTEVLKYLPDGTLITRFATYGKGDSQMVDPTFVHVDGSGTVYVADTGNDRIQKFTLNQPPAPAVSGITPNYGTQGTTVNVRIDGNGFDTGAAVRLQMDGHTDISPTNVTVVSGEQITCTVTLKDSQTVGAWTVRVTNTDGQYGTLADGFEVAAPVTLPYSETYSFAGVFGKQGSENGEFNSPQGIVTDTAGNIYVVDQMNHRIQKFASDGTFLTKWGRNGGDGSAGTGDGEFDSPQGIAIDAAGNLYVTDTGNNRVQKFTSAGVFVARWGAYGSDDDQFNTPLGIAVDDEGAVYVADSQNNRIVKCSSDGNFITKWDSENPVAITVFQSNIYVRSVPSWYDCGWHYKCLIIKYNNVGSKIQEWSVEPNDCSSSIYIGIASDTSGNLYAVRRYSDGDTPLLTEVLKYLPDGTLVTRFATYGMGDGQMVDPTSIHVDGSGTVYVADTGNNRIQKFTLNQPPGPAVTGITPNYGTQGTTVNVSIDGSGFGKGAVVDLQRADDTGISAADVTVVSEEQITCTITLQDSQTIGAWTVRVTNSDGQYGTLADGFEVAAPVTPPYSETYSFAGAFGIQGSGDGEFNSPQGIVTDTAGNIYVVDQVNHQIQKFASNGTYLARWGRNGGDGSAGTGDGEFNSPQGIAIDATGNLYVTDTGNNRVQKFTSAGEFVARWGAYGSDDDQFNTPIGIAVDGEGAVYVADSQNNRVVKYSSDGNFVTKWDVGGPDAITVFQSDIYVKSNIYIGWGTTTRVITQYNNVGSKLSEWAVESADAPGLASDASGNLYAVRRTSSGDTPLRAEVLKYLSNGTLVTRFATYGKGDGQLVDPTFIHVDGSGTVYVADTGNDRVVMFRMGSPSADFIGSPRNGTAPLTVQFNDTSVGEPTGWRWTFGDGTNSTEQHPVHTYTMPGNFTVGLTVSNDDGENTITRTEYISVQADVETNTVSVLPASSTMAVGQTQAYTLVLDNASFGLAGYNVTVLLTNSSVGKIIDIQYPSWASLPVNDTVPADAVWCQAADLSGTSGTANITLVTVTVRADAAGSTNVTVLTQRVEDRLGGRYESAAIDASLTVTALMPFPSPAGGAFPAPTDPNDDGRYEDLDGNGWIGFNDVVVYYDNLEGIDAGTFGPVSFYDYDGNGWAGFNDVVRLYGMIA